MPSQEGDEIPFLNYTENILNRLAATHQILSNLTSKNIILMHFASKTGRRNRI